MNSKPVDSQAIIHRPYLNISTIGVGDRGIVFLHGFGQTHKIFARLARQILDMAENLKPAEKFRLILFDSRGHGQSETTAEYTTVAMAEDTFEALNDLKIKQYIVIGFSDGANIGVELAALDPVRCAGLVAISPNQNPESLKPVVRTGFQAVYRGLTGLAAVHLVPQATAAKFNLLANQPQISDQRLASLTIPVNYVFAQHDVIGAEAMTRFVTHTPRATQQIIAGTNHMTVLKAWDPTASSVIREFLS